MKIFAIFDSKAEAYLNPFFNPTAGVALRSFAQAANDEQHDFNKFAGDYTLFELGSFDPQTGTISPLSAPHNLGTAHTLITNPQQAAIDAR